MPSKEAEKVKNAQMWEDIYNGQKSKQELFGEYKGYYGRVYRAVEHCARLVKKPKVYERTERPRNGVWFGKAGSGKTYGAEQVAIDMNESMFKMPIHQMKKGWYDGYAGETIILYDDFRGSCMEPHEFLNLLDGLQRLPIKGGYEENKARCLFFTSPDHPINWWPKWYAKDENNWAQVKRRLDKIYWCVDKKETETDINESQLYKNTEEIFKIN